MLFTIVPVISLEPAKLGAEFLPLDAAEGEAWKKALQAANPRLLPQVKESALLSEEESEFCVAGGVFDYQRGQELLFDGEHYRLSHCAEHFLDFLQPPEACLQWVQEHGEVLARLNDTEERRARFAKVSEWWQNGYQVLVLHHV